jgi:ubiquinone/menaquinone biosynthesis C-methylase UbiE
MNQNTGSFPVLFPPLPGGTSAPVWTGQAFRIGDRETAILSYETGESGWTDELTSFHEGTAGEDHYIDRASRRHTVRQLRRWITSDRPVIIDIGCSSGLMLRLLREEFPSATILGADYVRGPLEALARDLPGVPLIRLDLTRCPLPDQSVDGIVLLNVLEHIENDESALVHVARILKPDGVVVIEVPAGPGLYDVYDKLLLHHRRYRMGEIIDKASRSGLKVLEKSHLGFFLYPPFWMTKKRNQRYLAESEEFQKTVVSRNITTASSLPIMHKLMELEAMLRKLVYFPFGIRCLLTCRPIR